VGMGSGPHHQPGQVVQPTRHSPQDVDDAKGVVIPKRGNPDYRRVRAYREIALLDSLGKLVEKTAAHLIADQLERHRSLHEGQFGCRRRRACVDAVAVLINKSHQAWNRNRITGALLMDVKSAFNNVRRGHLIGHMMELGVENDLVPVDGELRQRSRGSTGTERTGGTRPRGKRRRTARLTGIPGPFQHVC